jgi:hypothetical protein
VKRQTGIHWLRIRASSWLCENGNKHPDFNNDVGYLDQLKEY